MKFLLLVIVGIVYTSADDEFSLEDANLVIARINGEAKPKVECVYDFSIMNSFFASDVYKGIMKTTPGDFVFSPISAEIILALVHSGAAGKTAEELSNGLHLPESKLKIQMYMEHLAPYLRGHQNYTLHSANNIYIEEGYEIHKYFQMAALLYFTSSVKSINFEKTEEATAEINAWVQEQTHNRIKDLINKGELDKDTRMVLINAMYFHGKWVHEFPASGTKLLPFYPDMNTEINITTMQQVAILNYYDSDELDAEFVELSYEGDNVTLTIVLPNEMGNLSLLEDHLSEVLGEHKFEERLIELKLPKFEIHSRVEFKPILQALGIVEAFTDHADFKDMVVGENLKLNEVIQKASIEVEEQGTIACVATETEMIHMESYPSPPVYEVVFDHPFIFFLKIQNVVFFVGRYTGF